MRNRIYRVGHVLSTTASWLPVVLLILRSRCKAEPPPLLVPVDPNWLATLGPRRSTNLQLLTFMLQVWVRWELERVRKSQNIQLPPLGAECSYYRVSVRVGSPPQGLSLLVSTAGQETLVVGAGGCNAGKYRGYGIHYVVLDTFLRIDSNMVDIYTRFLIMV